MALAPNLILIIGGQNLSSSSPQAHLRIGIPEHLLLHLRAEAGQGDVEIEGFSAQAGSSGEGVSRVVEAKSDQGNVTITGVTAAGGLLAKSSQGNVRGVGNTAPNMEFRSSQSNVNVRRNRGDLVAKSSQGNVTAQDNTGNIEAKTSQGNVTVEGQKGGQVKAHSAMGNVTLDNPEATVESGKADMGKVRGVSKPGKCASKLAGVDRSDVFDF